MAIVDFPLHVRRTGNGKELVLDLPNLEVRNAVWMLVELAEKKHGGYIRAMLDRPAKPVKTGPRGQVNRHWGHCQDIADQVSTEEHAVSKEQVDVFLRKQAVREDYPTVYNVLEDSVEAVHFNSALSVEYANIVEKVKQKWCDEREFYLTEYDETVKPPVPYRSVGGRDRKQMEVYWHEHGGAPDGSDPADEGPGVSGASGEVLDVQDADDFGLF
jgi:hypothetical protein